MNIDGKEQGYSFSRLWLNRGLREISKWDKFELEKRFNIIGDRFIKIWEIPDIQAEIETSNDEINIFDAEDPKFKKLEYAIFFNQKLEVTQVAKLYIDIFKQLFDLQPETFFTSDIGRRINLTKTPEEDGLRQPVSLNETYYIESNIDNVGKFDRIKQALTIFGIEDELSIKYAE
jgi:hypothetical protein